MNNNKRYKISLKNQKAIDEYIKSMISKGNDNPKTVESHELNIRKVLSMMDKDYEKIKRLDLDNIFSRIQDTGSRELAKIKFRCFLRYHNLNELSDYIHISSKYFKKSKKTDNDVLTPEEIQAIIDSPLSIRDKAIIELFLTTGMRRGEFVTLKYQNVEITKDEIIIKITKSKTRNRRISIIPYPNNPIAFYPSNFVSYYENHPFKKQPDKPLFFSISTNSMYKELNPSSLTLLFRKIQKRAEITKKITPHILRHTSATYDGYHLTEAQLELKYGWKPGSDMPKRYCHLNEISFNEHLKQKAGLTPEIIEKESTCPYCNHTNNINSITCENCKRTINKDEMAKQLEEREKRDKEISDQIYNIQNENEDLKIKYNDIEAKFNNIEEEHGEFAFALFGLFKGFGIRLEPASPDGIISSYTTVNGKKTSKKEEKIYKKREDEFRKFLFETVNPKLEKYINKLKQNTND